MKKKIIIIRYKNSGNIGSLKNSLLKNFSNLDSYSISVSNNPTKILKGDALILPGVGNASNIMKDLKKKKLDIAIKSFCKSKKPVLAICAGLQVMFEHSSEGNVECLKILRGKVLKIKGNNFCKTPSYGWHPNTKKYPKDLKWLSNNEYFYFIHSYYIKTKFYIKLSYIYCNTKIPSLIMHKNITGTQFHPELSGESGNKIIKYFLNKI
jgi:glutamine amidotransferase